MPVFKAQRPRSITDAVRLMASTKSEPDALDYLQVERAEADVRQRMALAEKARQEVEQSAAAERMRRDPTEQDRYASTVTGTPLEMVRQFRRHLNGDVVSPEAALTQGAAAGDVGPTVTNAARIGPTPMPNFTPQQSEAVRSSLGSVMASLLAPGRTNADQLTQAGGNLQKQDVVRRIQAAPTIPEANQLAQSINIRSREPFRETPSGILNEEAGTVTETPRSTALVETLKSLAGQRDARRDTTLNPPPRAAPAPRPLAPESAAYKAEQARRLRLQNDENDQKAAEGRAMRRWRELGADVTPTIKKKDVKLGAWDSSRGAFRLIDQKTGRLVGYFDDK